jgi:hypothetical protein
LVHELLGNVALVSEALALWPQAFELYSQALLSYPDSQFAAARLAAMIDFHFQGSTDEIKALLNNPNMAPMTNPAQTFQRNASHVSGQTWQALFLFAESGMRLMKVQTTLSELTQPTKERQA